MQSFLIAAQVVVPLMIYMIIGIAIRAAGIFSVQQFKGLNMLAFKILIPLSLFFSIYNVDLKETVVPKVFVFASIAVPSMVAAVWILFKFLINDKRDRATVIQGVYRSNFVLFGAAIAAELCDADGVALVGSLTALVIPMYNIFAVILFDLNSGKKIKIRALLLDIIKNPLVLAGVFGIILNICPVKIPTLIMTPFQTLGKTATPIALVTLGGILSIKSIIGNRRFLTAAVIGRLVVVPVIMIAIAAGMGFRGKELVAVLAIFASPTAVASTPMAQSMGGNGELAGEIVAMTSAFSIITIFLFTFLLSNWGLI